MGNEKKSKKVTTVKVIEKQPAGIVAMNPEVLITQAIQQGVPVETMERLLAMRKEIKAEYAKEQFDIAMAKLQMAIPIIKKTKSVSTKSGATAYSYAPLDSIVFQVKDVLKRYGFSYAIKTHTDEKNVTATCIAKHSAGHAEESSMTVPLGTKTAVMSDTQVVAAALTFAKRYAFCNVFGILTGDGDNDGQAVKEQKIEKTSIKELEDRALSQIKTAQEKQDIDTLIKIDEYVKTHKFSKAFQTKVSKLVNEAVDTIAG